MVSQKSVRDTVMKSLSAIGSAEEAAFFADLFRGQDPERFALVVIDPRCLRGSLLEALISDLQILSALGLTPILLIGALDDERMAIGGRTSAGFQAQRLCRELDAAGITNTKLNCASYALIPDVRKIARSGRFVVLEMTDPTKGHDLAGLTAALGPAKVIFLQPSGGFRVNDTRLPVVNIDDFETSIDINALTAGQKRSAELIRKLADHNQSGRTYVIASPLNLLAELFTVRGAGTMFRRSAKIITKPSYTGFSNAKIAASLETAFGQKPVDGFFDRPVSFVCMEESYRGGAIVTPLAGLDYLSKFWVTKEAQGEGIARDIWQALEAKSPAFFWRSRAANPFNSWYIKMCDGMQVTGDWRVFWKGLDAPEIPGAILAAANAPHDFSYDDKD